MILWKLEEGRAKAKKKAGEESRILLRKEALAVDDPCAKEKAPAKKKPHQRKQLTKQQRQISRRCAKEESSNKKESCAKKGGF